MQRAYMNLILSISPNPIGMDNIVQQLAYAMYPCKPVVAIDTIVVVSLFGQRTRKDASRTHHMQTFDLEGPDGVDPEINNLIYSTFEKLKAGLVFNDVSNYFQVVDDITNVVYTPESPINIHGPNGKSVFKWCMAAYSMVINPESAVKLSCVRMGPENTYGFTIHAKRHIKKGSIIKELIGLMPKDDNADYAEISTITPSEYNNQPPTEKRALCGPIRYINHICEGANTEFVAEADTSAFYAYTTRNIKAGEELFLDYGAKWFEKEVGGCPCLACKPDQQEHKRQKIEKDAATIEAEIRDARRAKLKRKRENKKLGKASAVAGSSK